MIHLENQHIPSLRQVEAVATFAELSVPLTARLAELLGLPGPLTSATDQVWKFSWKKFCGKWWIEFWGKWIYLQPEVRLWLVGLEPIVTAYLIALAEARDKAATRLAMKHNALPTPPVYEIRCDADVEPAAEAVGFPAVLKPV